MRIIIILISLILVNNLFSADINTETNNRQEDATQNQQITNFKPNLTRFDINLGVGFAGVADFSYEAGVRFFHTFMRNGQLGIITDIWFDRIGFESGYDGRASSYESSSLVFINGAILLAQKHSNLYFGLGPYFSLKLANTFSEGGDNKIFYQKNFDYGLAFVLGYEFDSYGITVGCRVKAGFRRNMLKIQYKSYSYYSYNAISEIDKNFSFQAEVGFRLGGGKNYNENRRAFFKAQETSEKEKLKSIWISEYNSGKRRIEINVHDKMLLKGNFLIGPIYIFKGESFTNNDLLEMFIGNNSLNNLNTSDPFFDFQYYLNQSNKYLSYSRRWLWLFFAAGLLCYIPSGINTSKSFTQAENAAERFNEAIQNPEKLKIINQYLDLALFLKEKQIEKEMKSAYSFIGFFFSGGITFIGTNASLLTNPDNRYNKNPKDFTSLHFGLRIMHFWAANPKTHLKIGLIGDFFGEVRNNGMADYISFNLMFAIKYKAFYLAAGAMVGIRTDYDKPDLMNDKISFGFTIEPGFIFGNNTKFFIGTQIKLYPYKQKFTVSDYGSSAVEKSGMPFYIHGIIGIGL